ncbi:hypothetical protein LZ32DRAFT_604533 [Colletotrichum eremochloae]|nr:hypothetical protein LZ32DRAFT_604533 [Colletotrichum eremochloae]
MEALFLIILLCNGGGSRVSVLQCRAIQAPPTIVVGDVGGEICSAFSGVTIAIEFPFRSSLTALHNPYAYMMNVIT